MEFVRLLDNSDSKKLYRITHYGINLSVKFSVEKFEVARETSASYFIDYGFREKRVPKEGKNLYAFDTIEGAWHNYKCRKKKQLGYLEHNFKTIKKVNDLINNNKGKLPEELEKYKGI